MIDFKAIFLPFGKADPDTFWIGVGLIALIDAIRLSILGGQAGFASFVLILVLTGTLFANRTRDAGRNPLLALIPVGVGVIAKLVTMILTVTIAIVPMFYDYAEARGVDLNTPEGVQRAQGDSELMAGFQTYLQQNEAEGVALIAQSVAWPSMIGFWATVMLIGIWFARMGQRPRINRRP